MIIKGTTGLMYNKSNRNISYCPKQLISLFYIQAWIPGVKTELYMAIVRRSYSTIFTFALV